jgi:hypothetical protein
MDRRRPSAGGDNWSIVSLGRAGGISGERLRLRKHDDLKVWRSMELRRTSRHDYCPTVPLCRRDTLTR